MNAWTQVALKTSFTKITHGKNVNDITEQIHMHKNKTNKTKKQKKQTGRDHLKAEIVLTDNLKLGVYNFISSYCPTDEI